MPTCQLTRTITILPVSDIARATAWYEHALGLETVYLHEGADETEATNYAILVRDGIAIHLILDEPPPHRSEWTVAGRGNLYLMVRDVDAFFEEVTARGVTPGRGVELTNWGARAFELTDPDGNRILVEEERKVSPG